MALVPVAAAARPALQPLLKQNQSTDTPARRRALGTLVTSQVALAVVLGIGAGLMLRTLWNLQNVDPGFSAANVLTFRLQTTSKPMNLTKGLAYFDEVLGRVRAMPEVRDVGAIQHLPMSGYNWTGGVWRPENPPAAGGERPQAIWRFTGWDYFKTMGIALRAGRAFTDQDRIDAPPVTIVNESLARREFGSAEGRCRQTAHQLQHGQGATRRGRRRRRRRALPVARPAVRARRCIARSRRRSCFRWRSS